MSDELTTIAVFETPVQAAMAQNYLQSAGISSYLADDAVVGMLWHLGGALGGVKLQVAEDQADKALHLLEQSEHGRDAKRNRLEEFDDEADEPSEVEPEGENDEDDLAVSPADELADRAFRAAVLGLFLCPLQLYSIWLLGSLWMLEESPSPKMKTRAALAALLDTFFLGYLAVFYLATRS